MERLLLRSITVIIRNDADNSESLRLLFELIKDYHLGTKGSKNTEVASFIQFLINESPLLKNMFLFEFPNVLECSICGTTRTILNNDQYFFCLNLRLPQNRSLPVSLNDLVEQETQKQLLTDGARCINCSPKVDVPTWQSRSANPPLLLLIIERIRVTNLKKKKDPNKKRRRTQTSESRKKRQKPKLSLLRHKINFSTSNLKFNGFPRTYNVVATIHGGLPGEEGHFWCLSRGSRGWENHDDMKDAVSEAEAPGIQDTSVCVILLAARGNAHAFYKGSIYM